MLKRHAELANNAVAKVDNKSEILSARFWTEHKCMLVINAQPLKQRERDSDQLHVVDFGVCSNLFAAIVLLAHVFFPNDLEDLDQVIDSSLDRLHFGFCLDIRRVIKELDPASKIFYNLNHLVRVDFVSS